MLLLLVERADGMEPQVCLTPTQTYRGLKEGVQADGSSAHWTLLGQIREKVGIPATALREPLSFSLALGFFLSKMRI